ncbi:MAG: alpha/beta hydrolase [Candidatus Tectomicrobia bacterium]|uniref:Alpha/beta hydrolase n=1 Tax=Tectimicrobiota bacterium TaxID=2528274 RepID=A0A932CN55_UNCTE|nr:alpha/beta hydrolase [Candidatus Tectomicrobia bacterium]
MREPKTVEIWAHDVQIPAGAVALEGELSIPPNAVGIVLFAHGSGSSRHSPRNQYVAQVIREAHIGTLLLDLLTRAEEAIDIQTGHLRFDVDLLASRLVEATRWIARQDDTRYLRIGYFGASTGGGAALIAASELGEEIRAIVSRGGRPDLAGAVLPYVKSPTLLIVGERDELVLDLNRGAYAQLQCKKELKTVRNATHLFGEPGALEEVARLATHWFQRHLQPR